MDKPVRVNTHISANANDWLDKRSAETALSKSALINIAIENYRKEVEVVDNMPKLIEKMRQIGDKVGV